MKALIASDAHAIYFCQYNKGLLLSIVLWLEVHGNDSIFLKPFILHISKIMIEYLLYFIEFDKCLNYEHDYPSDSSKIVVCLCFQNVLLYRTLCTLLQLSLLPLLLTAFL